MRIILLTIFLSLFCMTSLWAGDFRYSFYSDDSAYYLKLQQDGFNLRFRVDQDDCSEIKSAAVLIKSSSRRFPFYKVQSGSSRWPLLPQSELSGKCWFEAKVDGLDLNRPEDNFYLLELETESGQSWFFADYVSSIMPLARIVSWNKAKDNWISLGAFGSTPVEGGGVFFKIWEPEASRVDLFLGTSTQAHAMLTDSSKGNAKRAHSLFYRQSGIGTEYYYKFVKQGAYENLEVANHSYFSEIKVDPMARKIRYDKKGGFHNGYIHPRAVVAAPWNKTWSNVAGNKKLSGKTSADWIIYQLWPLTFNPDNDNDQGEYRGTFKSIAKKMGYLSDLGINSVEFLPIHESRFKASWGYALDSLIAVESTLGTETELQDLVSSFHQRGLRVIYDVVINHVNNDLLREPLSPDRMYTKFFAGTTEWGPTPDYKKIIVRKWIADCLIALMRDYRADGFRFDATHAIHKEHKDPQIRSFGALMLQELNALFKSLNPDFYSIAEELPDNTWITTELKHSGAGFDSQWNNKFKLFFKEDMVYYSSNKRNVNLGRLLGALMGYSDQCSDGNWGNCYEERHYGSPKKAVSYLGSHDFLKLVGPIVRLVSSYKRKINIDPNGQPLNIVNPRKDPYDPRGAFSLIHNDYTHAIGKLSYGVLFSKPGPVLFYQGEEVASDINIANEWEYMRVNPVTNSPTQDVDLNEFVGDHAYPWDYHQLATIKSRTQSTETQRLFGGYHRFFKDMIAFRKANPNLSEQDAFNVKDLGDGVIGYEVASGSNHYFIVANFGAEKTGKWVKFPVAYSGKHWWKEVVNSSNRRYGGLSDKWSNPVYAMEDRSQEIRLAADTFVMFQSVKSADIGREVYLSGSFNRWNIDQKLRLNKVEEEVLGCDFEVEHSGEFEAVVTDSDFDWRLGDSGYQGLGQVAYLTSRADAPPFKMTLRTGKYRFEFNMKTFQYRIYSR